MIRPLTALGAALILAAAPAPAAAQDAGALSWLVGAWRGAGTHVGRPSEATLEVQPALGGRFVELRYRARNFEGRAFYRPAEAGRWRAHWFDSRGVTLGIEAEVAGRAMTSTWGDEGTERGRTTYRLLDDGRLEIVDQAVAGDGSAREFARHVLTRAD